jgi:hypothetical protein
MLDTHSGIAAALHPSGRPFLVVTIDTEEEFDWGRPYDRASVGVSHVPALAAIDPLFARYGIVPTYLVDYPIASQDGGFKPLRDLAKAGRAEIGAHLHPWVNPPFDEQVSVRNSYPGNLPPALEHAKLARLTETIAQNFGVRPTVYRAGRYGVGQASAGILASLGYRIDSSVVPESDFRADGGPDFRHCGRAPHWVGQTLDLLEVPLTVGWCGQLRQGGQTLYRLINSPIGRGLRTGGILSRLGLFERIRLSPEGATLGELRRLTETLLAAGQGIFNFSFHSPSLAAGHTPYVRTRAELNRFRATMDGYFDYAVGQRGLRPITLSAVRGMAVAERAP